MQQWLARTAKCNATSLQPGGGGGGSGGSGGSEGSGSEGSGGGGGGDGGGEGGGGPTTSPVSVSASSWTKQDDLEWVQRRYSDASPGKAIGHAAVSNRFNQMFQQV